MPAIMVLMAVLVLIAGVAVLQRPVRLALAGFTALVIGWALQVLVQIAPSVALSFAEGLIHAFETDRAQWTKVVNVFTRELVGGIAEAADVEQEVMGGGLAAAAPKIAKPLLDAIQAIFALGRDLTPEDGLANLNQVLGLNVLLRLQGWWVELVGDLVTLGKFGAAADLPAAMEEALGLGRLGRLVWRPMVKKAIQEPLERLLNRQYRFTTYSLAEAMQGHHRGLLDDDAFLEAAHDLGYSYERAAVLLTMAKKAIPEQDVEALWRRQLLEEPDALNLITEQGYGPDRAAMIWEARRGVKGQTLLDELATTTRTLFKAGDLTEDEYRQLLGEAHFRDEEIDLALQADQLALRNERTLSLSQLDAALKEGAYTPEQYRAALRRLRYTDETIDVLLALQVRTLSPGQILELFSRGQLPRDQAIARLERQGYSAEDAAALLDLRTKTLSEGQVLDALAHQLINVGQAREALLQLGYSAEAVDLLISFQRKTLSPAEIQAARVQGLITEAEALGRLTAAGYSAADALTIVQLKVRLLTTGQILDAYADDLIDRGTAQRDLETRGLSTPDALTVLAVFDVKQRAAAARKGRGGAPPPAPPAAPAPPAGP